MWQVGISLVQLWDSVRYMSGLNWQANHSHEVDLLYTEMSLVLKVSSFCQSASILLATKSRS